MATVLNRPAINAAFLQEIKEDNIELRQLFRNMHDLIGESPPSIRLWVEGLAALRDQLAFHFSLEESYGYLDDTIGAEPRLKATANDLKAEHEVLYLWIDDILEDAEKLLYHEPNSLAAHKIAERFSTFRQRFDHHEQREEQLILQSLGEDIGVGD